MSKCKMRLKLHVILWWCVAAHRIDARTSDAMHKYINDNLENEYK